MGDMVQSTTIFDASDRPAFTIFKEQRIEVPLEKVSQNLIKAVISVEDQRFFDHSGIDAVRIGGALLKNLQSGRRSEGGSTITQQLARLMFLNRGKTYRRKLKEVIVAAYLENLYSKQEILEMYLNKVYFGDGLHGVEAAARGYFGKPAAELQVDEAALLAGLIQSPSSYAPTVNLDRAIARRNVVLQTMVSSGAIDAATAERAKSAPVTINNALEIKETFGLYFKEQVRRELVERFGWQRVYQGGLRVYTTIDSDLQKAAEAMLEDGLQDIERRPASSTRSARSAGRGARRARADRGARLSPGRADGDGPRERSRQRDGRRAELRREPLQPRRAGEAPVRIGVQAVRLRGGARGWVLAGLAHHRPQRSDPDRQGRLASRGRSLHRRRDDDAVGAADVEQPRGGADAGVGRDSQGRRVCREAQRRQASERAVAGARRERRDARRADRGLRRLR